MARYYCVLGLLLLALRPAAALAQAPLTLDAAVQGALAHNPALAAARAGAREAAARADEAHAAFFPRVVAGESWQRGDEPVFVFGSLLGARRFTSANFAIDALNHPGPTSFFHASFGIEQQVFDGGRTRAASREASANAGAAAAAADAAAADMAVATTETFGRVLAAQAAERASRAAVTAAQEDLARAERRRDAGVATDADVLALVLATADFEQRAIRAAGAADVARAELNRWMGQPVDRSFDVVEPPIPAPAGSQDVAALLAEADAARPELRQAQGASRAAEAAQHNARAAFMPDLVARAAVDGSGTRFGTRASSWLVGGELRWSWSTGGAETAALRAATEAGTRARAEMDDVRASVHLDVVAALRSLDAARARNAAAQASVDAAREQQRIIRNRFDAGLAPVNDVLRASAALLDAQANVASALVDATVAAARLRRALGRRP